jgi:hypothetical protein
MYHLLMFLHVYCDWGKIKQNLNMTSRTDYKTSLPWSPTADTYYVPFANNSSLSQNATIS